jgi:predicted Fe-Mo cluster-binding NifX family protein
MRVAVTSLDRKVEAPVSTPQGRNRFILILDEDGALQEAVPCSDREAVWGTGVSLAHLFVNRQVKAFLTPFCGPVCFHTLHLVGVDVITGIQGIVRDVVTSFWRGDLDPAGEPNIGWDAMSEDHEMRELMKRL